MLTTTLRTLFWFAVGGFLTLGIVLSWRGQWLAGTLLALLMGGIWLAGVSVWGRQVSRDIDRALGGEE